MWRQILWMMIGVSTVANNGVCSAFGLQTTFLVPAPASRASSTPQHATRSPTEEEARSDPLECWNLNVVPDKKLLAAARAEALKKDADWYQAVIGGNEDREKDHSLRTVRPATDEIVVEESTGNDTLEVPQALKPLVDLGYSQEEATELPEDIASIIVESGIRRPEGKLPKEWLTSDTDIEPHKDAADREEHDTWAEEALEEEETQRRERDDEESSGWAGAPGKRPGKATKEVRSVRSAESRNVPTSASFIAGGGVQGRRREGQYKKRTRESAGGSESVAGRENVGHEYRVGFGRRSQREERDDDREFEDFDPTFAEQEPGLLPLLLDLVAERVRGSRLLRPLLRESKFKYLLSQEADLRLMVTGPWAAELLQDEIRWRLGLFRDYLKVEEKGGRGAGSRGGRTGRGWEEEEEEVKEEDWLSEDEDEDYAYDRARQTWRRTGRGASRGGARGSGDDSLPSLRYSEETRPGGWRWSGEDNEDGVLEANWRALDAEEEREEKAEGVNRYTGSSVSPPPFPPSSSPSLNRQRRRQRRSEVRAGVGVDRRFMGQQEEEATNDRSGAWVWQNPGSAEGPGEGGRRDGGRGRREVEAVEGVDWDGFRWPWEMPDNDDVE